MKYNRKGKNMGFRPKLPPEYPPVGIHVGGALMSAIFMYSLWNKSKPAKSRLSYSHSSTFFDEPFKLGLLILLKK